MPEKISGAMGFTSVVLPLTLLFFRGSLGRSISFTCDPQTICALRESEVTLKCSHSNTNNKTIFWFSFKQKAKWRNEEHPEDLALDSDYAGRVNTRTTRSGSVLTLRELRERDSGEYQFLIITEGETHLSSAVVSLTVTDLWAEKITDPKQQKVYLTCSTSCKLTSKPAHFYWYKNGLQIHKTPYRTPQPLVLSSNASSSACSDAGSYSCSVSGHEKIRSTALRIFENCWNVTYTNSSICVLEGSSVDFPCTYSYPSGLTVTEVFWFYVWPEGKPENLSEEERFAGRVEFIGDKERNCTLRLRNVRKNDSGEYRFQFSTGPPEEKVSATSGVFLNVTDLQVRVSSSTASSDGQTVTLTCSSTCTLPNNLTYIWYKNGQPVTNKPSRDNKLYLNSASSEDALQYSCALEGLEGPEKSSELQLLTVGVVVFLALMLIPAALWTWYVRSRKSSSAKGRRSIEESGQHDSDPVYGNISALALTSDPAWRASDDEDETVHYCNLQFKQPHVREESVHYAVVNFRRPAANQ